MKDIMLGPARLDRVGKNGIGLAPELRSYIVKVIQRFSIMFAWGLEDMLGIDNYIIT